MNKISEKERKNFLLGKILFFILYLTLFTGFYFGEDSSGSGGFIFDFNHTWGYIIALQDRLFLLPSQWVVHTPYILIISKLPYIWK